MSSYKDLIVWQKSIELTTSIYKITESFPKSEMFGITSQMRRASIAIASNIAEGQRRGHKLEYIQFLRIAYGSGAELDTQLLIAHRVGFITDDQYNQTSSLLDEVMKMLNKMIYSTDYRLLTTN